MHLRGEKLKERRMCGGGWLGDEDFVRQTVDGGGATTTAFQRGTHETSETVLTRTRSSQPVDTMC